MSSKHREFYICDDGHKIWAGGKTKKQVRERLNAKVEAYKKNAVLIESTMKLSVWADICVDTYKHFKSDLVEKPYRSRMKTGIIDIIGHMPLKSIKPIHCQKCLNRLNDEQYSDYTIKQTKEIMYFLFDKAVKQGLINNNPSADLDVPKGKTKERRPLTEREQQAFLNVIDDCNCPLYFLFQFGCGCRPSEAKKIIGGDIVNEKGEFYFTHKTGMPYLHIRGTKTAKADRFVPIPQLVMEYIPNNIMPSVRLTTTKNNLPITDKRGQEMFKTLIRLMNIELGCKTYRREVINPIITDLVQYSLRHTFATRLANIISQYELKYLMGHSKTRTTDRYVHISNDFNETTYNTIINSIAL